MIENIGIVIINYNTYADTIECIDSIYKFSCKKAYHIFIIDNNSQDESGIRLSEYYKDDSKVDVVLSDSNLGFSGGNNLGIDAAIKRGCDCIFLINSDIVFLNDVITPMCECMERNDNAVLCGPTVFNLKNEYAQMAKKGITFRAWLLDKKFVRSVFSKQAKMHRFYEYSTEEDFLFPGMVSGCCFGIKTKFIKEIGGLDDNIFLYYEEDALAHTIVKKNFETCICHRAKVLHKEGVSTQKSSDNKLLVTRFYRWTSVLYVLRKYAKEAGVCCWMVCATNVIAWLWLSIFNPNYRKQLKNFIKENKRVMRC